MKKSILLSAVLMIALLMGACKKKSIKPSGDVTMENRALTGFTSIDVSDAIEVEVSFTGTESVMVEANSNLHQYILTDVVSGRLKIRLKNNIRIKSGATIKIYVSADYLEAVSASGASRVEFTNDIATNSMDLNLSGASTFQGGFDVTDCDVNISGASDVEIWGTASEMTVDGSGASKLSDYAFTTNNLDIKLSGASKAFLTANGIMNIEVSGASKFKYEGDALIENLDSSGASSVIKN